MSRMRLIRNGTTSTRPSTPKTIPIVFLRMGKLADNAMPINKATTGIIKRNRPNGKITWTDVVEDVVTVGGGTTEGSNIAHTSFMLKSPLVKNAFEEKRETSFLKSPLR